MSSKIATRVQTKHFGNASITTVDFQREDSSLRGSYPIPAYFLRELFKRAILQDPNLWVFLKYFKIPEGEAFHVLTQGNSNYPDIYCTADESGNLVINYQFMDVKRSLVYVTVTFPKDGVHYYVPKVEFIVRVAGENQIFTIDIDKSLFSAGFKLTKKQVLNLVFSCLGELALLRFFDYFVDTGLLKKEDFEKKEVYDKQSIINRFVRRISEQFEISFDRRARKITIGKRVLVPRTEGQDFRTVRDVTSIVALFWYVRPEFRQVTHVAMHPILVG